MRTDRFFYIPLSCSHYDKDIEYTSGKKSCCQFHKSSYWSSSGFTLVRCKCSTWSVLIIFFFLLGGWTSGSPVTLFPCTATESPGLFWSALRNTGLNVQTRLADVWSCELSELVDREALAWEWYSDANKSHLKKYYNIVLMSAEPNRRAVSNLVLLSFHNINTLRSAPGQIHFFF